MYNLLFILVIYCTVFCVSDRMAEDKTREKKNGKNFTLIISDSCEQRAATNLRPVFLVCETFNHVLKDGDG